MKAIILDTELNYNREYVNYLGLAPGESQLLMVNVTKMVKTIFMDNDVQNEDSNRIVYRVENFSVCGFLNNRLLSKLYAFLYEEFVGNATVFKCPIRPGVYYLKNSVGGHLVPSFHPSGKFRLSVRLKAEKQAEHTTEFVWRYRVVRT
ncbi:hypothetical protein KR009_002040 [Drosophila setifemur]|nr:hypothetical protein KR009_002040 [Drosophila setifemur]